MQTPAEPLHHQPAALLLSRAKQGTRYYFRHLGPGEAALLPASSHRAHLSYAHVLRSYMVQQVQNHIAAYGEVNIPLCGQTETPLTALYC